MSKSVLTSDVYRRYNSFLLEKLSYILNHVPDFITEEFAEPSHRKRWRVSKLWLKPVTLWLVSSWAV